MVRILGGMAVLIKSMRLPRVFLSDLRHLPTKQLSEINYFVQKFLIFGLDQHIKYLVSS